MLPFITDDGELLQKGVWVFVKDIRKAVDKDLDITAYAVDGDKVNEITLRLGALTEDEKQILKDGCLINFYKH